MHVSNKELFCETLNSSAGRTRSFSNVNRKGKLDARINTINVIKEEGVSLKIEMRSKVGTLQSAKIAPQSLHCLSNSLENTQFIC